MNNKLTNSEIKHYNTSSAPLTVEQIIFIYDNCFFNLGIDKIENSNIPIIYDEMLRFLELYQKLNILPMVTFVSNILDILYDNIDWEKIENDS